ncbi:hypothetical protein BGY98DRAFT_263389 [Russula aff. rugulosa BPL654]|nr:hypothetical protein BGY98DRAFT_263389 [Russula aff. rugulosa BPL654]
MVEGSLWAVWLGEGIERGSWNQDMLPMEWAVGRGPERCPGGGPGVRRGKLASWQSGNLLWLRKFNCGLRRCKSVFTSAEILPHATPLSSRAVNVTDFYTPRKTGPSRFCITWRCRGELRLTFSFDVAFFGLSRKSRFQRGRIDPNRSVLA